MNRKNITVLLLAAVLLSASSCGNSEKILESTKEETAAVMTIGGYDVPYELYRYVVLNYKAEYEEGKSSDIWLGESGQLLLDEMNGKVEETLSRMYTTMILCEEYGIGIDDELIVDAVDVQMDAIYEGYENDYKVYDEAISEYNMTDGVYRFIIRNDVLTEELFNAMLGRGEISTDEDTLRTLFESDAFIRVKQILISADNGNSPEENREKAEELLAKAKSGEDFDELVQKYGQDLYMFNNNDGYYMMKGTYFKEFEDAAFSLEIGEISDVVESSAGFSIIRRYEKEDAYLEKNFDDLAQIYFDSVYNTKLEATLAGVKAEPTELYHEYNIFNME